MREFAVSEHGNQTTKNVVRTLFCHHDSRRLKLIDSWINVPKKEALPSSSIFFNFPKTDLNQRSMLIAMLRIRCIILSKGQRCKDWFLLRLFRLTGTLFSKGLLSSNHFREIIKLQQKDFNFDDEWKRKMLDDLVSSWFSNNRSTDSMKRGTANEIPVIRGLQNLDFVVCFYEVGMFCSISVIWVAVSPDGVGVIDISKLKFEKSVDDCFACSKISQSKEEYLSCKFAYFQHSN